MNQTFLAIAGLGTPELIVIVLVIFLLFGATRLPQLAKALGQSKKAFREGIEEGERETPSYFGPGLLPTEAAWLHRKVKRSRAR